MTCASRDGTHRTESRHRDVRKNQYSVIVVGKPLASASAVRPGGAVDVWLLIENAHSIYTHFPKDRNCEICQRTKITRAPCRRRNGEAVPRAANFGDLITADHKVLSDNCESRNNHRYAVVVQDLATQWIQAYPCKNKTSQETQRSLQKFLEPDEETQSHLY